MVRLKRQPNWVPTIANGPCSRMLLTLPPTTRLAASNGRVESSNVSKHWSTITTPSFAVMPQMHQGFSRLAFPGRRTGGDRRVRKATEENILIVRLSSSTIHYAAATVKATPTLLAYSNLSR